jgi:hypothetical protein
MDPAVWGKHGWIFLHSLTMAYPDNPSENDIQTYKNFFMLLPEVLPCSACRQHLKEHFCRFSLTAALKNKKMLVEWLINIHNETNKSLGKQTKSFDEVIDIYKSMYSQSNTQIEMFSNKTEDVSAYKTLTTILGLCVIILIIFIWNKKNVLFV